MRSNAAPQETSRGLRWSLGGGVLASLCCVGPLVAILLGVGGAASMLGLLRYKIEFIAVGLVVTLVGIALALRRSKTSCSVKAYRRNRILIPAVSLLTFAVLVVGSNVLLLNDRVIDAASSRLGQADESASSQLAVTSPRVAAPAARQLDVEITSGVYCPACLLAIQHDVAQMPGVAGFTFVNGAAGFAAQIVYDPAQVDQATLLSTIASAPGSA
ncbi:MAG: hypothetical protein ACRDJ9_19545, partial [Dehalococcoidia bacterium]